MTISPVQNGTAVTTPNAGNENYVGTDGLVNLNTANWRVLSMIEMIPRSQDPTGSLNRHLAKLIVRYRDFDDGMGQFPHPHGPFLSVMELNKVFDPNNAGQTFQNALTKLGGGVPVTVPTREWGAYTYVGGSAVSNDFQGPTLMVNRISNMVTLRSDSFTAYVMVQQWRNVGTPFPELVAQQRQAMIIDRSSLAPAVAGSGSTSALGITAVQTP